MPDVVGFTEENVTTAEKKSVLAGMGESVIVEVFNPLTSTFRAKFARSIPQAVQLSEEEKRVAEVGGIDVRKQGGSNAHVVTYVDLEPGKTMKLPGNVAQVVVNQLTTYIIQQQGKRGLVSDPTLRRETEQKIIVNYRSILETNTLTPDDQFKRELEELNNPEGEHHISQIAEDIAFPTERETNESIPKVSEEIPSQDSGERPDNSGSEAGNTAAKRPRGRPKVKK